MGTRMAASSIRRTANGVAEFCCLAYCPSNLAAEQSTAPQTIMVLVRHASHGLEIYMHPRLWQIVLPEDRYYLDSLLNDLPLRAEREPDELFLQMSNLGVGPLITRECGVMAAEGPGLPAEADHFIHHDPAPPRLLGPFQ